MALVSAFVLSLTIIPLTLSRPMTKEWQRVHPEDFAGYRSAHKFKFPCCLCAAKPENPYIESAIYIPVFGPYASKYVAGCATGTCGYLSMSTLPAE
jgi:hypothetical protein